MRERTALLIAIMLAFFNVNTYGEENEKAEYVIDLSDEIVSNGSIDKVISDSAIKSDKLNSNNSMATTFNQIEETTEITTNSNSTEENTYAATEGITTEETSTEDVIISGSALPSVTNRKSSDYVAIEETTSIITEEIEINEDIIHDISSNGVVETEIENESNVYNKITAEETTSDVYQEDRSVPLDEISTDRAIDVITEETTEETTEESTMEKIAEIAEKDVICNVSFPTNIKAYFDPQNLSGKGQVFSNKYSIINYGNTDVAIKIKNVDVIYRFTQDLYEFAEDEVNDDVSEMKKMNINMVWDNENENIEKVINVADEMREEYVIYLKASEYDENGEFVGTNKGSEGIFYFNGSLNSNPDIIWVDSELTVHFDFEIKNGEDKENKEELDAFMESTEAILEEENLELKIKNE